MCGGVVVVAVVLVFGKCGCLKVSFTTHKRIFFGVHFGCFGFVFRSVFFLLFISFVVIVNFDFFNFYFWHFSVWPSAQSAPSTPLSPSLRQAVEQLLQPKLVIIFAICANSLVLMTAIVGVASFYMCSVDRPLTRCE